MVLSRLFPYGPISCFLNVTNRFRPGIFGFVLSLFISSKILSAQGVIYGDVVYMNDLIARASHNLPNDTQVTWTIFEQILALHCKIQQRTMKASRLDLKPEGFFRQAVYCRAARLANFNGWDFRRGHSWWDRTFISCVGLNSACYDQSALAELRGVDLADAKFNRFCGLLGSTLLGPGLQVFVLQALLEPMFPWMYTGGRCLQCGFPLIRDANKERILGYLLMLKDLYKTPEDWIELDYCSAPVGQMMLIPLASHPPAENIDWE